MIGRRGAIRSLDIKVTEINSESPSDQQTRISVLTDYRFEFRRKRQRSALSLQGEGPADA